MTNTERVKRCMELSDEIGLVFVQFIDAVKRAEAAPNTTKEGIAFGNVGADIGRRFAAAMNELNEHLEELRKDQEW